jgi:hypothetical protein
MNEDAWLESWGKIPTLRPDVRHLDWLGGECWSMGVPMGTTTSNDPSFPFHDNQVWNWEAIAITPKQSLLRELLLLSVRLEDFAAQLDSIRERLEKL